MNLRRNGLLLSYRHIRTFQLETGTLIITSLPFATNSLMSVCILALNTEGGTLLAQSLPPRVTIASENVTTGNALIGEYGWLNPAQNADIAPLAPIFKTSD